MILLVFYAGRVGKTSLVLRYVNDVFSEKQEATVQASYLTKRLVIEGVPITLAIWVRFFSFNFFISKFKLIVCVGVLFCGSIGSHSS